MSQNGIKKWELYGIGAIVLGVMSLYFYVVAPKNPLLGCLAQSNLEMITRRYNPLFWASLWFKAPTGFVKEIESLDIQGDEPLVYAFCPLVETDYIEVSYLEKEETADPEDADENQAAAPPVNDPNPNEEEAPKEPEPELMVFHDVYELDQWLEENYEQVVHMRMLAYQDLSWTVYSEIITTEKKPFPMAQQIRDPEPIENPYFIKVPPKEDPPKEEPEAQN